jgi:MYXO-CTERM domain-containing protein
VTVNTIAGTQPDGTLTGPINPTIDTRAGTVTGTGTPNVARIENLGYEMWQDSIGASSTAADLGTLQYLGALDGYLIMRGEDGSFPTLAGLLGSTRWPAVDTAGVGGTHATATGVAPFATIADGVTGDEFSAPGNGGLALSDFGGDLGAYLDAVVVPNIDALSESFVYLTSAGVGINNSFDPVFGDTNGYDVVLIAQSPPIPEPGAMALLAVGGLLGMARRRNA